MRSFSLPSVPATPALVEPPVLRFAGHLQYPLRESWMIKGLQALAEAERQEKATRLFTQPEATDRFGIRPTMVQAMRFWLRATGVMVERSGKSVRRIPTLTPIGHLLQQVDPYLERTGSAWVLHAHLVRNLCMAPTFTWFFQHFVSALPFTSARCAEECQAWAIKEAPTQDIRAAAVRSDIACLLRMYLPSPLLSPEHLLATSPFHRLNLLKGVPVQLQQEHEATGAREPPRYGFCPPQSEEVPALVMLAMLLENAGKRLPLRDLLWSPLQIGRTFGLSQEVLLDLFACLRMSVPAWCPRIERIGPQQWVSIPTVSPTQALQAYYAQR